MFTAFRSLHVTQREECFFFSFFLFPPNARALKGSRQEAAVTCSDLRFYVNNKCWSPLVKSHSCGSECCDVHMHTHTCTCTHHLQSEESNYLQRCDLPLMEVRVTL